MALVNMLAMCADVPLIVISINKCMEHMSFSGKKEAVDIAQIFKADVSEYDADKTLADIFFFDDALNVQKAGEILTVKYPRVTCCHGEDHVLALFFSDFAKIPVVKVLITLFCDIPTNVVMS